MLMLMFRRPVAPQARSSAPRLLLLKLTLMMSSLVMLKRVEAEEEGKEAEVFSGSGTARKTEKNINKEYTTIAHCSFCFDSPPIMKDFFNKHVSFENPWQNCKKNPTANEDKQLPF